MHWPCERCHNSSPWNVRDGEDFVCVACVSRARAIRAVVAAQWAVAVAIYWDGCNPGETADHDDLDAPTWVFSSLAALPTAEQIVDGAA